MSNEDKCPDNCPGCIEESKIIKELEADDVRKMMKPPLGKPWVESANDGELFQLRDEYYDDLRSRLTEQQMRGIHELVKIEKELTQRDIEAQL